MSPRKEPVMTRIPPLIKEKAQKFGKEKKWSLSLVLSEVIIDGLDKFIQKQNGEIV